MVTNTKMNTKLTKNSRFDVLKESSQTLTLWTQEGGFPLDSEVTVSVASISSDWHVLYRAVIQDLIENSSDLYVRGVDRNGANGFAYVSGNYALRNSYFPWCGVPPEDGYLAIVNW